MGFLTRSKKQETRQSAFLKVVHPHGYVEIFCEPITAGEIMRRYPRHCVARPDFFEFPWIVVRPESILVPGKVFYLVPFHTIDERLKAKRQELQSLNLRKEQSAKQRPNVIPKLQQEGRYCWKQTNHRYHHHHHTNTVDDEESSFSDRHGQDSDSRHQYRPLFYRSWNEMRENLHQPYQESYFPLDSELDSPLHSRRPHVTNSEQVELQRVKSCMRKADSGGKKLKLKVSFASPVVIPGSQRGSPSI